MVILGGLEIVVGGYLVHRYHKNKNEKKRLQEETHERRHNTFPGAKPQSHPQPQQPTMPQQKYACYAPQPQPHPQLQPRPHTAQPQPHPQTQAYAGPHFQQQIQPLQRTDSFATLSNMPVANGPRYQRETPPRRQPIPQRQPVNHPYYNTGFSASYPSFDPSSTAPAAHPTNQPSGTHTVDDNWETYGTPSPHVHFAVSGSAQPGEREDDPPPPYRP